LVLPQTRKANNGTTTIFSFSLLFLLITRLHVRDNKHFGILAYGWQYITTDSARNKIFVVLLMINTQILAHNFCTLPLVLVFWDAEAWNLPHTYAILPCSTPVNSTCADGYRTYTRKFCRKHDIVRSLLCRA
jgi:hypothetical protein